MSINAAICGANSSPCIPAVIITRGLDPSPRVINGVPFFAALNISSFKGLFGRCFIIASFLVTSPPVALLIISNLKVFLLLI